MGIGHIVIILVIISVSMITIPVFALENGLYEGQWVKYQASINFVGDEAMKQNLKQGVFNEESSLMYDEDIQYFKYEIILVSDDFFEYQISMKQFNGDEQIGPTRQSRLGVGEGIILIAIPVDSNIGDVVGSDMGFGIVKVTDVEKRNYRGKVLDVFRASSTTLKQEGGILLDANTQYFFDKQTGILLELIVEGKFSKPTLGVADIYMQFKAIDFQKPIVSLGGGCLIATATFGTELAPQVQQLRELRDSSLLQTTSGSAFMIGFNQLYYSFSPSIADFERENSVFRETVKLAITPLLMSLSILNYLDVDSEVKVLGFGIGVILLNIGMYFVGPAILIQKLRKKY